MEIAVVNSGTWMACEGFGLVAAVTGFPAEKSFAGVAPSADWERLFLPAVSLDMVELCLDSQYEAVSLRSFENAIAVERDLSVHLAHYGIDSAVVSTH